MHARKTAIGFYEKLGYKVKGDQFEEVTIPHFLMEKCFKPRYSPSAHFRASFSRTAPQPPYFHVAHYQRKQPARLL